MGDKNNKKGGTFASAAPNGDETKDRAWSVVVGPKRRGGTRQHALKSNSAVVNGVGANGALQRKQSTHSNDASEASDTKGKRGDFNVLASFPIDLDGQADSCAKDDDAGAADAMFVTPVATQKISGAGRGSGGQRRRGNSTGKKSSSQKTLSSRKMDIWSRLMTNLSRAIDDVYFMSEVECSSEQVKIVEKVLRNSLKDFESLASSIESQKHFEKEREEATNGERKRMTVAWDVRKTIKVSPKHLELLSTLENEEEDGSSGELTPETSFDDFLHQETNENLGGGARPQDGAKASAQDGPGGADKVVKARKDLEQVKVAGGGSNWAWREERNWGDIFNKEERARDLQAKLLSPERQKLTPLEAKKRADEKQARASLFRKKKSRALAERLAKADETRQAIRSQQADKLEKKIHEMDQKIQRGRQLRSKHIAAIAGKAKSENMKVNEVIFITNLEAEDKKAALNERMQETEARRQEILAAVVERQRQTDAAIEEAQRRKQKLEEERLKLLAEEIHRKEQIQLKLQQERQQAAEAREALAEKQRIAAEEKEADLIRKKIADRLAEARKRRTLYIGQIKEKASLNKQDGDRRDSGAFSSSSPYLLSPVKSDGSKIPSSPRIGDNRESEYLQKHLEDFSKKIQHFSVKAPPKSSKVNGTAASSGQEDQVAKKRYQKTMRDLKKLSSKNNVGGIHSLCIETMHHLDSGKEEHLNLARECGLVDFVLDALSKPNESWPERTKILLLRLFQVVTCNGTGNAAYLLSKNACGDITNLLMTYTEADCFNAIGSVHSKAVDVLLPTMSKLLLVAQETNSADFESVTGFFSCSGLLHQIRDSFPLFDPSKVKNNVMPTSIENCLRMLDALSTCQETQIFNKQSRLKVSTRCFLAAFKDASMIGLPSLITTVLLHTSQATSEIDPAKFPGNFTTSAYFVVKVLNNMAVHDYQSLQRIMGSADLKAESFHLLSSLLSYCTSLQACTNRKSSASKLLNEVILLVGNFVVLNSSNQSVLHWGKSPTILEKLCQLPFNYFFEDELQKVLNPTLLAACFENDRNREVIERNVSLKFVCKYLEKALGEKAEKKTAGEKKMVDRFALEHRFPLSLAGRAIEWISRGNKPQDFY